MNDTKSYDTMEHLVEIQVVHMNLRKKGMEATIDDKNKDDNDHYNELAITIIYSMLICSLYLRKEIKCNVMIKTN